MKPLILCFLLTTNAAPFELPPPAPDSSAISFIVKYDGDDRCDHDDDDRRERFRRDDDDDFCPAIPETSFSNKMTMFLACAALGCLLVELLNRRRRD
jgi:hypothetical protein